MIPAAYLNKMKAILRTSIDDSLQVQESSMQNSQLLRNCKFFEFSILRILLVSCSILSLNGEAQEVEYNLGFMKYAVGGEKSQYNDSPLQRYLVVNNPSKGIQSTLENNSGIISTISTWGQNIKNYFNPNSPNEVTNKISTNLSIPLKTGPSPEQSPIKPEGNSTNNSAGLNIAAKVETNSSIPSALATPTVSSKSFKGPEASTINTSPVADASSFENSSLLSFNNYSTLPTTSSGTSKLLPPQSPTAYLQNVSDDTINFNAAQTFENALTPKSQFDTLSKQEEFAPLAFNNSYESTLDPQVQSLVKETVDPALTPLSYENTPEPVKLLDETAPEVVAALEKEAPITAPEELQGGVGVDGKEIVAETPVTDTTSKIDAELATNDVEQTPPRVTKSITPTTENSESSPVSKSPSKEPASSVADNSFSNTNASEKLTQASNLSNQIKVEAPSKPNDDCELSKGLDSLKSAKNPESGCINNAGFISRLVEERNRLVDLQINHCSDHDFLSASGEGAPFKLNGLTSLSPTVCRELSPDGPNPMPAEIEWYRERQKSEIAGSVVTPVDCNLKPQDSSCCLERAEDIAAMHDYLERNRARASATIANFCKLNEKLQEEQENKRHIVIRTQVTF